MWQLWLARITLTWYFVVLFVITIGIFQLHRYFSWKGPPSTSTQLPLDNVPHVTIIRPIVGKDPYLYECLAATFRQDYPASKLTVRFCIPTKHEPALPVLKQLLEDFPEYDAQIYIAEEDPVVQQDGAERTVLGPNPKIRNMSRAYREAKGDIVWIIDCNVWVGASVAGHMVDQLCGFGPARRGRKFKFAHQIPLAVDVSDMPASSASRLVYAAPAEEQRGILPTGSRLEEMFLSTSHAKFYTAISSVAIAPCTVGKSNMFRRSHLDALTPPSPNQTERAAGIDFFSENICEDHLISDLLWRSPVPASVRQSSAREGRSPTDPPDVNAARPWGNHAILLQPPCIQPVAGVSLLAYAARRSRWLRVRKFTVPAATAVEPGTESFVATAGAAYALTTLPYFETRWGIPPSWPAFVIIWTLGVLLWCIKDWFVWGMLQSWQFEGTDMAFVGHGARRRKKGREGLLPWLKTWIGRECLAFPIWAWAILGGVTVTWRGKRFWVGLDMKVHEIRDGKTEKTEKAEKAQ